MTALLERLFDLIQAWISYLLPFTILGDDKVGLVRRLGCYRRDLKPGLNLKWPLIEEALSEVSALDSTVLREQTLTSSDGRQVTLRGVLAYRVVDARKYILECATAESVVNDVGCGVVAEIIPELEASVLLSDPEVTKKLTVRMRARAKRWGIHVESFGLVDRVEATTYRIVMGPLSKETSE